MVPASVVPVSVVPASVVPGWVVAAEVVAGLLDQLQVGAPLRLEQSRSGQGHVPVKMSLMIFVEYTTTDPVKIGIVKKLPEQNSFRNI